MFNWREDATFFLYKSAEKEIYYQKRNGIVDIFVYYIQSGKQELWIQDGFLSCEILYQSANIENTPFCYVLLKDNIFESVCAAITTFFHNDANGICFLNPLTHAHDETW